MPPSLRKFKRARAAWVGSDRTAVIKGVDAERIPYYVIGFELKERGVAVAKPVVVPATKGDVAVDVVAAEGGLEMEGDLVGTRSVGEDQVAFDVEHHEMTDVSLSVLALAEEVIGERMIGRNETVLEDATEIEVLVAVEPELAEGKS